MKHTNILASLMIIGSVHAGAAQDYNAIKPGLGHMTQALQAAFKAEPTCDYCRGNIKAIYLAGQGALFELSAPQPPAFAFDGAGFPPTSPDTMRIVRNRDQGTPGTDRTDTDTDNKLAGLHKISIELEQDGQALPADDRKANAARQAHVQQVTFKTFCDHGKFLSHLPAGEHVTLVFGFSHNTRQSQVFVFDKTQVENCNSTAELRQSALAYLF